MNFVFKLISLAMLILIGLIITNGNVFDIVLLNFFGICYIVAFK